MITVLKQKESVVFATFAFESITGPVLGVIIGGNVTTSLGGYNAKNSLRLSVALAAACVLVAAPIPFMTNYWVFNALLWLLFFTGGFILPCLTGIMLNTVAKELRTTANSLANLSYNLCGFLPAPFIYGAIFDLGEGGNSRSAMSALMFTSVICFFCIFAAAKKIVKEDILGYQKNN